MRVLFASTAGAGHVNPMLPWIAAVRRAGHEAMVVVPPEAIPLVANSGAEVRAGASPDKAAAAEAWQKVSELSLAEAQRYIPGEIFCGLNSTAMLPPVRAAISEYRPDLVLRDSLEYASAAAADEAGTPHARIAVSLASPLTDAAAEAALESLRHGLLEAIVTSPYLTRFPASLDESVYPMTLRYRAPRPDPAPLPDWWHGSSRPLVYVTFGTVAPQRPELHGAFHAALCAVAGLPVRVLLTVGHDLDVAAFGPLPDNVHCEPWVDQDQALACAAAVLSHGGSGTVLGAVAAGVPQVILPMFADQPANARTIAAAGAGISLESEENKSSPLRRVSVDEAPAIRQAIHRAVTDDMLAARARALKIEMASLPTEDERLRHLLAAAPTTM